MDSMANAMTYRHRKFNCVSFGIVIASACIIVCLGTLIFKATAKAENKKTVLKNNVMAEAENKLNIENYSKFAKTVAMEANVTLQLKTDDLDRLSQNQYNNAHITMWDNSALDADWYAKYFGESIEYGYYSINTPSELVEYLHACLESDNELDHIYLNIDPYLLRKNYYDSIYYDNEDATYEEFIEDNIFTFIANYPDVDFNVFLPVMSLSYLANLSSEEFEEIYSYWYTFAMYLRWYPNATVSFAGAEEWIVVNDNAFKEINVLDDEISKLINIYLYSDTYKLTPPELKGKKAGLYNLIEKYKIGAYDYSDLPYDNVIFVGDELFSYPLQEAITIPGYLQYFTSVQNKVYTKGGYSSADFAIMDTDICIDGDNALIIVSCGINDYLLQTNLEEFKTNITNGVYSIKESYPKAAILLVAPHYINYESEAAENDYSLADYAYTMKRVALNNECKFVNLYAKGGVSSENSEMALVDGIHQSSNTGLFWSTLIAKEICN